MATAKAAPLSILPAGTEEEQQKFAEVEQLRQQLKDALDYRKGFYLDPTMLAIAQGFAAPTRTGSFFESLGNVATNLGQAQEAERKRAQEIAQMRLELASSEYGTMQQQRMAREAQQYALGVAPSGAPSATPSAAPSAEPSAGTSAGVSAAQPIPLPGGQLTGPRIPTVAEIEAERLRNPQKAAIMERFRKDAIEGTKITDKGVFTMTPGEGEGFRFTPTPGGATVERFEPGVGNLSFNAQDAARYDLIKDVLSKNPDSKEAQAELRRLITMVRGGAEQKQGPMTPSEAALEAEVKKQQALDRTKSEGERYSAIMNRVANAPIRIATYENLIDMASKPSAQKFLGVFEGSKFNQQVMKLAEGAGLPEVREIYINLGLDKGVKTDQQVFQQQMGAINLEIRKMTRTPGEGAMSDFESKLALAAGLDRTNTPEGMVKKIKFLKAKDDFDLKFARALKGSGKSYDEFVLNDPTFQDMAKDYYTTMSRIVGEDAVSSAQNRSSVRAPGAPAVPGGAGESAAAKRLREWQERQRRP